MRKIFYILPIVGLFVLLGSCEGHYRYPCQDPANWGKLECNNDVCKAEGTCTSDVLAPAGSREFGSKTEVDSTGTSEEDSSEEGETEISSTGCTQPTKLSYKNDIEERIFNVKHKMELPVDEGNSSINRDVITLTDEAAEQPVTMKSEVDALEHDRAVE